MSYPIPTKPDAVFFEIMVERIMTQFKGATDDHEAIGRSWYPDANGFAADIADGNTVVGAGVLAALSANRAWEPNKDLATRVFSGDFSGTLGDALRKAERIMNGEDPAEVLPMSIKTGNFYRNIVNPDDDHAVTVDRHAHDVAAGERYGTRDRGLRNVTRYRAIADAYREAAQRLGELPSTVQAVTWCAWREQGSE